MNVFLNMSALRSRFRQASSDQTTGSTRSRIRGFSLAGAILVAAVAFGVLTGCESGGGGDGEKSSSPGNSVVGTWSLSNAEGLWFIFFKPDNTWTICDNADGSQQRVYGTYTVSGKTVRGPMTNPGVGTGEIVATVDGNNIALAFIEHWHSPYKVVNYTGNRL